MLRDNCPRACAWELRIESCGLCVCYSSDRQKERISHDPIPLLLEKHPPEVTGRFPAWSLPHLQHRGDCQRHCGDGQDACSPFCIECLPLRLVSSVLCHDRVCPAKTVLEGDSAPLHRALAADECDCPVVSRCCTAGANGRWRDRTDGKPAGS